MNIGALEWVLKQLDTLQEQSVWHDVEKETPTSFGEGVIVLCKNKNKEDGIWLTDFIPCWEGEWKPRDNWETPVKWAYVRDFYPKAEQSVTLSVQDAMKSLDEKIAKVKKAGSWKNPELLDEMRAEQPVCDGLKEEINRWMGSTNCFPEGVGITPLPKAMEIVERTARHFAKWGAEHAREQMMDEWLKDRDGCFWDGVEEGKKAMEEQMMKGAVEGEVCGRVYDHINVRFADGVCKFLEPKNISHIPADVSKYNIGQKVKIIIVKEEKDGTGRA